MGADGAVSVTSFFLIWSTAPETFPPRAMRAVESVCVRHASAQVDVLSNTLPVSFFALQRAAGCDISVERYDLDALVRGTAAEVWYVFRRFWNRSIFYPNHEADLLRLLRLNGRGGVYVDTDVVFLRPLTLGPCAGAIGIEHGEGGRPAAHIVAMAGPSQQSEWAVAADAVMCNAVMAFPRAAPLIARAVDTFAREYVPLTPGLSMLELHARGEWGAMGPLLLTRLARRSLAEDDNDSVCVLERAAFYAISPPQMATYFGAWDAPRDAPLWDRLHARSIAVHYWNALTARVPVTCGGLMHRLLDAGCLRAADGSCVSELPCKPAEVRGR